MHSYFSLAENNILHAVADSATSHGWLATSVDGSSIPPVRSLCVVSSRVQGGVGSDDM